MNVCCNVHEHMCMNRIVCKRVSVSMCVGVPVCVVVSSSCGCV